MFLGIIIPDRINKSIYAKVYDDYLKRIGFYCQTKLFDFKSKYTKDFSKAMAFQRDKILDISNDYTKITVEANGKLMDSLEFSKWMENMMLHNITIFFILGGAFGLPEEVVKAANDKISLGKLTLSHEIALLVLLEQIYRSFTILNNHPYNK